MALFAMEDVSIAAATAINLGKGNLTLLMNLPKKYLPV